jgi:hypothetical protein
MTLEEQGYHYTVQAFSFRRGHYVTLFAPFLTKNDATRMIDSLQEKNPQIKYRVATQHNWLNR